MASFNQTMQGIDKVLLIAGTDEVHRLQQHQHVLDAPKKAGVQWLHQPHPEKPRHEGQQADGWPKGAIKASGLSHSLFRNVLYVDALPQFVGEKVFEAGIYMPAGQGPKRLAS